MKIYCARAFTQEELQWIAQLIENNPQQRRTALSRQVCEQLNWRRPDGTLKDMTCRVAMLRMQADAVITLPASISRLPRARLSYPPTPASDPRPGLCAPVHELGPLRMEIVRTATPQSRLWNEYVARYHYLGYTPMSGSQIRYNIFAGEHLVALLSFGASAWKLADRERFIGWSEAQRSAAKQEFAARSQQRPLPDPALDPIQGPGLQDFGNGGQAPAQRLARALRLPPRNARDFRAESAPQGHLLQGRQLGAGRQDRRARQEEPYQQADPANQRYLALPAAPRLQQTPLRLVADHVLTENLQHSVCVRWYSGTVSKLPLQLRA